jgi:hypothetical protein
MQFPLHAGPPVQSSQHRMCQTVAFLRPPRSTSCARRCKRRFISCNSAVAATTPQQSAAAVCSLAVDGGLLYGGLCSTCGKQHLLRPTSEALEAAADLITQLDATKRIDFNAEEADARFSTDFVWTKGPGRMFGVLHCRNAQVSFPLTCCDLNACLEPSALKNSSQMLPDTLLCTQEAAVDQCYCCAGPRGCAQGLLRTDD